MVRRSLPVRSVAVGPTTAGAAEETRSEAGRGDLTDGVAVRLSALCLDDDGRLRDYDIWDAAARAALLVDLALADRVAQEVDSVVVDATPTGFPPADALLTRIAVAPEQPLDWWIDHGGVDLGDLVRETCGPGGGDADGP